ncbi:hypothetical protein Pyn_32034 [Prunus yedoensis var. nudiflora]|uniref:Uncharacterized protein n=1 Tax=Prunus yedoensis var. nudiflora TaxID=2094558 RepID=A0A314XJ37_PRUYE|nr:hypothetical protein Pyn_32034 [Prunus yedoensis var. nudiflora]
MKALLYERELRIQELELKLAEVMNSSEAEAHTKTLLSESRKKSGIGAQTARFESSEAGLTQRLYCLR